MYKLKLIKGRSYLGLGLKATNLNPIVTTADKAQADKAVASGYFALLGVIDYEPKGDGGDGGDGGKIETPDITKFTEKQLDDYAAEKGIDLKGLTKKADKLAKIQAEETAKGDGGDGGNEPNFDGE